MSDFNYLKFKHPGATAAIVALLLGGCGDKPKPPTTDEVLKRLSQSGGKGGCKPAPIEVYLQASPYLNQNVKAQSMPVEVRILLLKARETYDETDFETLWQRGEEVLAHDLVRKEAVTVFPGKDKIRPLKSQRGVAYIALVGIFRKPQGRQWQQLYDVRQQNKRCATDESLHTIVHAVLKDHRIMRAGDE